MAACAIGSDIYVFSGISGGPAPASVFKLDTAADEWSTLAPMPFTCSYCSASVLGGLVYIVGAGASDREVLRFDPASGTWSKFTLAPTSSSRTYGASFVVGGCLYGAGGSGRQHSSVQCYNVVSNTWADVADMLGGRHHFCAVAIESVGPAEELDLFDSLIAKASRGRP
jgi:hypothetical protein